MHTHTVRINITQRPEVVNAFELVRTFSIAEVAEGGLLKITSPVPASAPVHGKYNITALCHILIPEVTALREGVMQQLYVRPIVEINNDRVFLCTVEMRR